jgi:decaprenyl-phosphate phosphoribosyltransferase
MTSSADWTPRPDANPPAGEAVPTAGRSLWRDHLGIARIDHWVKNVFMLPGTALAFFFVDAPAGALLWRTLVGFASLCLCASANYTVNEFVDGEFDRFHPVKRMRPAALGLLDVRLVALQYVGLVAGSLGLAVVIGRDFAICSVLLLVMGVIYNARPIRAKDRPYLDVLSEAFNNPLRLLLGWFAIVDGILPPSSILASYWLGGAFLMAVKRFNELRSIADRDAAGRYRLSFRHYSEDSLLLSSFFYALCSSFFLGVFLIKYRIEFLLVFPLFALMFTWYLAIGLRPSSSVQAPERLYTERPFLAYVGFVVLCVAALFFVDIPQMHVLVEPISVR